MSITVCVDKIEDNTEQPLKPRQSKQTGHSDGVTNEIVNMNSTICVDKIEDNTEQPLTPRH